MVDSRLHELPQLESTMASCLVDVRCSRSRTFGGTAAALSMSNLPLVARRAAGFLGGFLVAFSTWSGGVSAGGFDHLGLQAPT